MVDTPQRPGTVSRRSLLGLFGAGAAGAAFAGPGRWFVAGASSDPPGPTIPVPTVAPQLAAPAEAPSLAELAASLQWDVDQIFRYVADEITVDRYDGALRGATGTLWGRAGNSVDKALLLAALLAEAAVPYRFALGALADDAAGQVGAASSIDLATARRRAAGAVLDPAAADSWTGDGAWSRSPDVDALFSEAHQRVDASVTLIADALAAAGVTLAAAGAEVTAGERERHVWVQYADGPDWIDLDPTLPGAEPGRAPAAASETPPELPDDLFHTVTFRVVAEHVAGGVPARRDLLTHTVRSADMAGVAVMLLHPSAEWLGVAEALTGDQRYVPTLLVGSDVYEGTEMSLSTGEGVLGVFDDVTSAEGQTVAEWLEVEIGVPGGETRLASRSVFDRIPAADRLSGSFDVATLGPIELIDVVELGRLFLPLAGTVTINVSSHALPAQIFTADPATVDDAGRLAKTSLGYHALRDAIRLDTMATFGRRWFADEPNVVAWWAAPAASPDGTTSTVAVSVDILHAHHGDAPLAGATQPDVHPQVVAGALDHAAERLMIEGTLSIIPDAPESRVASAGLVFERAAKAGIGVVTLLPGGAAALPDIGPAATRLVSAALDRGHIVIVPASKVDIGGDLRVGWWEVDPVTGQTVDRMDDGRGADLAEYMMMVHHLVSEVACAIAIGAAIGSVINMALGVVGAGTDAAVAVAVGAGQCILAAAGGH